MSGGLLVELALAALIRNTREATSDGMISQWTICKTTCWVGVTASVIVAKDIVIVLN